MVTSTTSTHITATTNSPTVQKIITSTGQIITQQMQGNVISSANLQQLLQQRPGQKILIQQSPGGVQKIIVAAPSSTNTIQQGGEKRIFFQNSAGQQQQIILNQNNVVQQSPQQQQQQTLLVGGQKIILQNAQQQLKTITTSQGQQIHIQVQEQQQQQQQQPQQIVMQANGSSIAQQLAQGKIQVINMNGQQVLVKNVGANQVIVGQVKSASSTPVTPVKQVIQPTLVATTTNSPQFQQQIIKTVQSPMTNETSSEHAAMLANHPPGTIIKCVTASVMQTANGPRIVLQGLQGNEFNPQQTLLVQQQVKQQLMKGKILNNLNNISQD